MKRALAILPVLLLIGCSEGAPGPRPIEPGDMCAQCRMAISQQRFAAETADSDGNVKKFDDIGCMRKFTAKARPAQNKELLFVADYDDTQWLPARDGFYVQSATIPSPMASGLLAVRDRTRAEKHAQRFHGRLLTYAELFQ